MLRVNLIARAAAVACNSSRFIFYASNKMQPQFTHMRSFSTSSQAYNTDLIKCLDEQIGAEQELGVQNLEKFSFPGFSITQKEAEVRLLKKYNNEEILAVFNVNHSVSPTEDNKHSNHEDSAFPVARPPVTIEITKGDERLCFHLELCDNENGEYDYSVEEFYLAPAVKRPDNEDVPSKVYASSGAYIDPILNELLFVRYLEERGFDVAFCKTLIQYATHYEHAQYVNLLHKLKAFVKK